jgi:hypothetical protein
MPVLQSKIWLHKVSFVNYGRNGFVKSTLGDVYGGLAEEPEVVVGPTRPRGSSPTSECQRAEAWGPFLNSPPGAKLSPGGKVIHWGVKFSVCPSILLNSRVFTPWAERRVNILPKEQISQLGAKFIPRGEVHPWGPGVNYPQFLNLYFFNRHRYMFGYWKHFFYMVLDIFIQTIITLPGTYPYLVPWFFNAPKVRYRVCLWVP